MDAALQARLDQRRADQLYRQRRTLDSAQGPRVRLGGRELVNFCSNDYLGLAADPRLRTAAQHALDGWGVGSGASHLVCGHTRLHQALEERLAAWTGRDRALLFSTGYMANIGVISALVGRGDHVLEDRLNHASLLDGGLLSGARLQRFLHNDVDSLGDKLRRISAGQALVAVDGVFSMDGDLAPLPALAATSAQHGAWLMVDDAHGLGVLGDSGAGSCEQLGLGQQQVPILMGTLGKALGSFGAFVAGSETLIESLIQFARPYIYTTALPPSVAAATLAAVDIAAAESWRRETLQILIARFRRGASQLGLNLGASDTPIQPLLLGDSARATAWSEALLARGFWVSAIRPPTVPAGSARLRITLTAGHETADIDHLLEALDDLQRKHG
ncbi:MAG TPA: 8-amino-7-oxononanoate synthase [Spongiibacteraceae bacterium]|nr:8-amino-7-oxononanoate synthase [Spongiibacteraceae bacterium]HUH39172.1 8-amino-7-oxononanoate synthase [Spongiibacteraceae bacterium]